MKRMTSFVSSIIIHKTSASETLQSLFSSFEWQFFRENVTFMVT